MTDGDALFKFRQDQALTMLSDARKMREQGVSPRSVVNRAYYAMFYMVQALFIKSGIPLTTSKHSGVISLFDKSFILTGKVDKKYSKILHSLFDDRLESDYKDFVEVTSEEADKSLSETQDFINAIQNLLSAMQ
jgi:uncharacterized protein (UPF0332 family)